MTTPTAVEHGGTDAGPSPRLDLSSNANPYGPSPAARAALRADVGPYPDPAATRTVARLADHHGLEPEHVVVGAGATELIDRLVRTVGGPVAVGRPTFGEYAGAAARHGVRVQEADEPADAMAGAALAFVADPGNPDGALRSPAADAHLRSRARANDVVLVRDLAYRPMLRDTADVYLDHAVHDGVVDVHAPNKAHGCTGLRAGWCATTTGLAARLRAAGVTWGVSVPGLAFLAATATADADAWVRTTVARVHAATDQVAAALRDDGHRVVRPDAPFALVHVGDDSATAAARLRTDHGIRVRRTDSMGLAGWWRLGGLREEVADEVVAALRIVLSPDVGAGGAT